MSGAYIQHAPRGQSGPHDLADIIPSEAAGKTCDDRDRLRRDVRAFLVRSHPPALRWNRSGHPHPEYGQAYRIEILDGQIGHSRMVSALDAFDFPVEVLEVFHVLKDRVAGELQEGGPVGHFDDGRDRICFSFVDRPECNGRLQRRKTPAKRKPHGCRQLGPCRRATFG